MGAEKVSRHVVFALFSLFLLILALKHILSDLSRVTLGPGARDVLVGRIAHDVVRLVVRGTLAALRWGVRLALVVVGTTLRLLARAVTGLCAAGVQAASGRLPRVSRPPRRAGGQAHGRQSGRGALELTARGR